MGPLLQIQDLNYMCRSARYLTYLTQSFTRAFMPLTFYPNSEFDMPMLLLVLPEKPKRKKYTRTRTKKNWHSKATMVLLLWVSFSCLKDDRQNIRVLVRHILTRKCSCERTCFVVFSQIAFTEVVCFLLLFLLLKCGKSKDMREPGYYKTDIKKNDAALTMADLLASETR
jgi:hypothetical protein